jgi:hypothetical protein
MLRLIGNLTQEEVAEQIIMDLVNEKEDELKKIIFKRLGIE